MKLSNNIYIVTFNKDKFSYLENPSIHLDFKKYFILMNHGETNIIKRIRSMEGIFNMRLVLWDYTTNL